MLREADLRIGGAVAVLLAVALQVATTVTVGGVSLRVGASDPLLIMVVAWALWTALKGAPLVPETRVRHLWAWLAVLTAWIAISVINGRLQTGEWVAWGVVNRGLGWLVLVAYLAVGAWITGTFGVAGRERFLKAFLLFGWTASLYGLTLHALYLHGITIPSLNVDYWRIEGFLENPNAFGFAVAGLLVLQGPYLRRRPLFPAPLAFAGMGVALLALVFSGSRSAWLGLVVAWPVLVFLRALKVSDIVKGTAVAVLLGGSILYGPPLAGNLVAGIMAPEQGAPARSGEAERRAHADSGGQAVVVRKPLYFFRARQFLEPGVAIRLALTREAVQAWHEAPVAGVGLGTFYWMQDRKNTGGVTTIHTTLLWLLTETGLIGAGLFAAFYLVCARGLVRRGGRAEDDPFLVGVFGLLLVFAGASLGTDVMYQRHLWVLAGMALAVPGALSGQRPPARGR